MKPSRAFKAADAEAFESLPGNVHHHADGSAHAHPVQIKTASGIVITANPDKTTTVLGTFRDDTGRTINADLGLPNLWLSTVPPNPDLLTC